MNKPSLALAGLLAISACVEEAETNFPNVRPIQKREREAVVDFRIELSKCIHNQPQGTPGFSQTEVKNREDGSILTRTFTTPAGDEIKAVKEMSLNRGVLVDNGGYISVTTYRYPESGNDERFNLIASEALSDCRNQIRTLSRLN